MVEGYNQKKLTKCRDSSKILFPGTNLGASIFSFESFCSRGGGGLGCDWGNNFRLENSIKTSLNIRNYETFYCKSTYNSFAFRYRLTLVNANFIDQNKTDLFRRRSY